LCPCRTGPANGTKSACHGKQSACGHTELYLYDCRLSFHRATLGSLALCYGTMDNRRHAGAGWRSAGLITGQPGYLYTEWYAAEYHHDTNQSERQLMDINYPFYFDSRGRTAQAREEKHIRDLIEQVLFTSPGERVNRPDFGCGLMQLVFAPNSDELATATQYLVQGSLQRWLGELIQIEAVEVTSEESTIEVKVQYIIRKNQERKVAEFSREV